MVCHTVSLANVNWPMFPRVDIMSHGPEAQVVLDYYHNGYSSVERQQLLSIRVLDMYIPRQDLSIVA